MSQHHVTIGIIGGSGMLGRAIALALLKQGHAPENLWISNRSGTAAEFEAIDGVTITDDNQALVDASDLVLLSVPPAMAAGLTIDASGKLVASVMAGVTTEMIMALSGADRVVRAMSSPAAEHALAYSPWCASAAVTGLDRLSIRTMFEAGGKTDELDDESQLDLFTAMTGPVPGFVAYFAEGMVEYAVANGIPITIADRAIRQLFLGAGTMMATGTAKPSDHVQEAVDYAGTTAAGLTTMRQSMIKADIAAGLDAAASKARSIG